MERKKVLYIITKSNWGGAQRYVYDLATNLPDSYEPVVVGGAGGILLKKLTERSVRTIHIASLARDIEAGTDIRALIELYRVLRKERPHVVHLNSSKAGFLGAIAARLAGVKHIVFTVHGWPFNEPVSRISKLIRWCAITCTMLLVHRTITVSQFAALLAPLGLKTKIIHNGIASPHFLSRADARRELCARTHIPEDAFIFGTIAELHPNKGIDILVEATYLVDDVYVVVIGGGEQRAMLIELIHDLQLEKRVHLLGFIDNAAQFLKGFDAFILPSRTEALGYVLIEAGMAEVPIIASAVGGIPEVVHDQVTGDLFHAYNDIALAESMEIFKSSPNTLKHYAEAEKAHVDRYFNLHVMIQKTILVYEH